MKMKEWIWRAGRTFVQAFVGMVSATLVGAVSGVADFNGLKTAVLGVVGSGIAAGIAAIMNYKKEDVGDYE